MQTDIAGELVREVKTLWEKLRDGIAGTNQEVMAAVDSLRRKVRSTSVREAPTIPTIPEITQMSERLGGFGPTQEGTRMVRPVPQMPHPRPHMIPQMMPDVPTSHWQGDLHHLQGLLSRFHYMHLHMAPTHGKDNPLITVMTQPTQPDDGDLQGNIDDPRRSNRERHEPNRLSLSGPRHAAGRRKKTASKRAEISRAMTDHDDE
uniref:Uncharacterized protein n=1 Tax=Oryza punctata TaxID=4537 RepID=A0A0E0K0U8_ORYPU